MENVMIRLGNMSFAAGCTVLLILVLRVLIKRLPKAYSYGLWMAALFRFLCPVDIVSPYTLFPVNPEPVRQEIVYQEKPGIETGVVWIDQAVNRAMEESLAAKTPENSINPIQTWLAVAFAVWVAGMSGFVGYHLLLLWKLQKKLATAVRADGWEENGVMANQGRGASQRRGRGRGTWGQGGFGRKKKVMVKESDQIGGAFVLGFFHPVIYLPSGLEEGARLYVLRHEQAHIRRNDYVVKMLGFLAVAVHWFNPLSWVAFRLLCADMEMSCDESVLKNLSLDGRKAYSRVLLAQAETQSGLLPLAFGKNYTYQRIRNILSYHKPGIALTAVAAVALAAVGIGLMTSPEWGGQEGDGARGQEEKGRDPVYVIGGADGPTSIFVAGKWGEETFQAGRPDSQWLASVQIKEGKGEGGKAPQGSQGGLEGASPVFLDFASGDSLIFHGDFGVFSFERGESGQWTQQLFIPGPEAGEALDQVLEGHAQTGEAIQKEDVFRMKSRAERGAGIVAYSAVKMADGRIGVLGGRASSEGVGSLIDLFYGYYDPGSQEMDQVFLFLGDQREQKNPEGETSESYWLFSRDGFDYYVRTPREAIGFEKTDYEAFDRYHIPYGRMELARSREGEDERIDDLMYVDRGGRQKVVLTEGRLVYMGFEEATLISVKRPLPVSICLDGSGRQAGMVRYGVAEGMCYADGYLYYEGWTNDAAFPKPLMRMRADFTGEEKIGELPGSLVTVREDGTCIWMDWEEKRLMAAALENLGDPQGHWEYLENGETRGQEACHMENMGDGQLRVVLSYGEGQPQEEVYWLWLPSRLWEEDF